MKLKESYLIQVPAPKNLPKKHDDEVENVDGDLAKTEPKRTRTIKKPTVRKVYVERADFPWRTYQEGSFVAIKEEILSNAMSGADHSLQFHLAVDAS